MAIIRSVQRELLEIRRACVTRSARRISSSSRWTDRMIAINLHPTDRMLRQFAGAWLVAFSGLAATQWLLRGHLRTAAALFGVALIVGVAGLLRPRAGHWLFVEL